MLRYQAYYPGRSRYGSWRLNRVGHRRERETMLTIKSLGDCKLDWAGSPHTVPAKVYLLLLYLAYSRKPVRRLDLARLLWPTSASGAARHSLSQLLYYIRTRFKAVGFLVTNNEVQLLDGNVRLDVNELVVAASQKDYKGVERLYGGRFLKAAPESLTPELELFAEEVQTAICPLVQTSFAQLALQAEASFEWEALERYSRGLIQLWGGDKLAYEKLVTALVIQKRFPEAEQVRATAREWLNEDIAIPLLAPEGQRIAEPTPFVGRVEDFSTCRRWWERAKAGVGGMYLIAGEAGIGKTRLANQLLRLVAIQGGATYDLRCFSNERRLAYSCAARLATSLQVHIPQDRQSHTREGLSLLLPDLVDDPALIRRQLAASGAADRALLTAFADILRAAESNRPSAIFVDDLQWADAASTELLGSLATQLSSLRLLIVGAYRTDEQRTPHLESLISAADGSIELAGLRQSECEFLLESTVVRGSAQSLDKDEAIAVSLGNPFLLLEIARHHNTRDHARVVTPAGVAGLVRDKWTRLTPGARRLAQASAVLDQFANLNVARRVAGIRAPAALSALEELIALGFLNDHSGTRVTFRHDLVREVVYRSMPAAVRRATHDRAVSVLKAMGNASAGVIALHAYRAGLRSTAYASAMKAAQEAVELGAYSEAGYYHNLARRIAPTKQEWQAAAEAKLELAMYTGDLRSALRLTRKLRQSFEAAGNKRGLLICEYCDLQNDISQGMLSLLVLEERVATLLKDATIVDAGKLFVRAFRELSIVLQQSGKMDELANLMTSGINTATAYDEALRGDIHNTAAIAFTFLGDSTSAVQAADEGVRVAKKRDDVLGMVSSLGARGVVKMAHGLLDEAEEDYARAMHLMRGSRLPLVNMVAVNYGVLLIERDRIPEALQLYATPDLAGHRWRVVLHANATLAQYEAGFTEQAELSAHRCVESARDLGADWARIAGQSFLGLLGLDKGDVAAGLSYWEEVRNAYVRMKYSVWDPTPILRYICRGLVAFNRGQEAVALLDDEINRISRGNVFVSNKLRLEYARIVLNTETAAALQCTNDVREFARRSGAHLLARQAARLMDDIALRIVN